MVWRDHVFNYGPKSATRVTKFREKELARRQPRQFFLEILVVLEILEKNSRFRNFFPNFWIFWKFWKLWVIISKVVSTFWRWEGYMVSKMSRYRSQKHLVSNKSLSIGIDHHRDYEHHHHQAQYQFHEQVYPEGATVRFSCWRGSDGKLSSWQIRQSMKNNQFSNF